MNFIKLIKIVKILGTPNYYDEWSEGYRFMENLNMKSISEENRKNYYNNRVDSPTFLLPQINNNSINASDIIK